VLRSIVAFAKNLPGVSEKEIKKLYGLRSDLVHGGVSPDLASSKRIGKELMRLLEIAQIAIKARLGWSRLSPPDMDLRQGLAANSLRVTGEHTFRTAEAIKVPLRMTVEPVQLTGVVERSFAELPPETCGI
jgi:hypothetical protein